MASMASTAILLMKAFMALRPPMSEWLMRPEEMSTTKSRKWGFSKARKDIWPHAAKRAAAFMNLS